MTAKRKIDTFVQRKFHHHHSDDFYAEKSPIDFLFKIKKQNLLKQYSLSDWFDSEEELPLA